MPTPISYRVQSTVRILDIDSNVSELIEEGCGKWKENQVDGSILQR